MNLLLSLSIALSLASHADAFAPHPSFHRHLRIASKQLNSHHYIFDADEEEASDDVSDAGMEASAKGG